MYKGTFVISEEEIKNLCEIPDSVHIKCIEVDAENENIRVHLRSDEVVEPWTTNFTHGSFAVRLVQEMKRLGGGEV